MILIIILTLGVTTAALAGKNATGMSPADLKRGYKLDKQLSNRPKGTNSDSPKWGQWSAADLHGISLKQANNRRLWANKPVGKDTTDAQRKKIHAAQDWYKTTNYKKYINARIAERETQTNNFSPHPQPFN